MCYRAEIILAALFILPGWVHAGSDTQKIAQAYGIGHWKNVEAIRFTFEPKIAGTHMKRAWLWEPHANRVTCQWKRWGFIPRTHTYSPGMLNQGNKSLNEQVDRWFINDKYWFLFPYQLVWDTSPMVIERGEQPLPIQKVGQPLKAKMLTVTYPRTGGGYTPGDAYDVYYTPEGRIEQWSYHKGGAEKPTLTVTWEKQERAGPLLVSMDHRNQNGLFHLNISDVAVKLVNDPVWYVPQ
jgi:hypothetical protein